MSYIIKDFILNINKSFCFKPEKSCYLTVVRDVLSYHEQSDKYSVEKIALLTNSLNIKHKSGIFYGYDFEDKDNYNLLKHAPHMYNEVYKQNFEDIISDAIKNKEPVICYVQAKYLQYHRVYKNADNQLHAIIIFGYDDNQYYIYDPHIRLYDNLFDLHIGRACINDILYGIKYLVVFVNKVNNVKKVNTSILARNQLKSYMSANGGIQAITDYLIVQYEKIKQNFDKIYDVSIQLNYDVKINGPCYACQIIQIYNMIILDKKDAINRNKAIQDIYNEWTLLANSIVVSGLTKDLRRFEKAIGDSEQLIKKEVDIISSVLE